MAPTRSFSCRRCYFRGNIHIGIRGLVWAREHFSQTIIYVVGNHEYYRNNYQKLNKQLKEKANELDNHLLMNSSVIIDNVLFVGVKPWTGFELYQPQYYSQLIAQFDMSDYKSTQYTQGGKYRKLTPPNTTRMHIQSLPFIKTELIEKAHSKSAVITHHAPSKNSMPIGYEKSELPPDYASDLEQDMKNFPVLWGYGHTYNNIDYTIGDT